METINISLPESMAAYVRRKVDQDYGNASEFFRELIRLRMSSEIEADVALLKSTGKAPAGPTDADVAEIIALQRRVRKGQKV